MAKKPTKAPLYAKKPTTTALYAKKPTKALYAKKPTKAVYRTPFEIDSDDSDEEPYFANDGGHYRGGGQPFGDEVEGRKVENDFDFEFMPGRESGTMEFMEHLNCDEKLSWCRTQAPGTCAPGTLIEKSYGLRTCKMYDYIKKRITEDIIGIAKPEYDYQQFEDIMINTEMDYDKISQLNFKTFVESFSSYGNGIEGYDFFVNCNFQGNPVLRKVLKKKHSDDDNDDEEEGYGDLELYEDPVAVLWWRSLIEHENEWLRHIKRNMIPEELFLEVLNGPGPEMPGYLTVEEIKKLYQDHMGDDILMQDSMETMNYYEEGSLSWWKSALRCEVYVSPIPLDNTNVVDPQKSEILNELFRSDAEISGFFTGQCFDQAQGFRRAFQESRVPLRDDSDGAAPRGPIVKDILEYFRKFSSRSKALEEFINLINHFKEYGGGSDDYERGNLVVEFFLEFVKLISFDGGENWSSHGYKYDLTNKAEQELNDALNERMLQDQKTS